VQDSVWHSKHEDEMHLVSQKSFIGENRIKSINAGTKGVLPICTSKKKQELVLRSLIIPFPYQWALLLIYPNLDTFILIFSSAYATQLEACKKNYPTFATVSPIGHGRCGDLVAKTPIFPPFSLGTLTYPTSHTFVETSYKNNLK
jgi:hypothetical protein